MGDSGDIAAALVAPIRPDAPCGESLDDSAAFYSLESSSIFGRHTPPPETTEWREIRKWYCSMRRICGAWKMRRLVPGLSKR